MSWKLIKDGDSIIGAVETDELVIVTQNIEKDQVYTALIFKNSQAVAYNLEVKTIVDQLFPDII